jgi:hypothetical protein
VGDSEASEVPCRIAHGGGHSFVSGLFVSQRPNSEVTIWRGYLARHSHLFDDLAPVLERHAP